MSTDYRQSFNARQKPLSSTTLVLLFCILNLSCLGTETSQSNHRQKNGRLTFPSYCDPERMRNLWRLFANGKPTQDARAEFEKLFMDVPSECWSPNDRMNVRSTAMWLGIPPCDPEKLKPVTVIFSGENHGARPTKLVEKALSRVQQKQGSFVSETAIADSIISKFPELFGTINRTADDLALYQLTDALSRFFREDEQDVSENWITLVLTTPVIGEWLLHNKSSLPDNAFGKATSTLLDQVEQYLPLKARLELIKISRISQGREIELKSPDSEKAVSIKDSIGDLARQAALKNPEFSKLLWNWVRNQVQREMTGSEFAFRSGIPNAAEMFQALAQTKNTLDRVDTVWRYLGIDWRDRAVAYSALEAACIAGSKPEGIAFVQVGASHLPGAIRYFNEALSRSRAETIQLRVHDYPKHEDVVGLSQTQRGEVDDAFSKISPRLLINAHTLLK